MVNDIRGSKRGGSPVGDENKDDLEEVRFVPPEIIAKDEEVIDMSTAGTAGSTTNSQQLTVKTKNKEIKKFGKLSLWLENLKNWWGGRTKKQKIIIGAAAALALILLAASAYLIFKPDPPKPAPAAQKIEEKKEPPKPTTEASKLTGVQVPPEYNLLPVTGIMIENSPDARPQSGLHEAGVVFEAIAEGGITRFLTLYQEAQPDYVGPVRSVRPYYLQWLQGFDAAIAHVGGSGEALAKIRNEGIKDLDQSFNGGAFQRVSQRYAPHNVYTGLGTLIALGKTKGYNKSEFAGFPRKVDAPAAAAAANAKSIGIAISGPLYNVNYSYDAATNSYPRNIGGLPHKDERSGKQITPKVVIAIVVPQSIHPDRVHTSYAVIGSGQAYIFQDGTVTVGTWSKASDKEQILFGDANSAPIGLNAGQTWISVVGSAPAVTFTP